MILLNNVAEEIGWAGFVFARFQDRHGPPRAALLTTVFLLFHVPSFYVETRSWMATATVLGLLLLPHLGSRFIVGWLYNSAGSQRVDRRTVPRDAQGHRELHWPGCHCRPAAI